MPAAAFLGGLPRRPCTGDMPFQKNISHPVNRLPSWLRQLRAHL
jgi:hypothetical protein